MKNKVKEPGIISTIRKDLREEDLFRKLRKELESIREFYIDADKQLKLRRMNHLLRIFFIIWWILKGMFFKLNPLRRVLLVFALLLNFTTFSFGVDEESRVFMNNNQAAMLF